MGRILQIRVSATTWDEREVMRSWPTLCTLVWEDYQACPEYTGHGVLDLVEAFTNGMRFALWGKQMPEDVRELCASLEAEHGKINMALEKWDAQSANKCSVRMEDLLTQVEQCLLRR